MKDHFYSSRYCLNHAKGRINELVGIIDAFVETDPCESVIEHDADTGEGILKIKLVKPMPIEIPGVVFDALNSLRAALDHAGYATSIADGKPGDHAHFPFGSNLEEIIGRRAGGRSREIPQQIFDVMVNDCKPYLGGDDILWALNRLCNGNKHVIIIPFAMGTGVLAFSVSGMLHPVRWSNKEWDRTKNERELARIAAGAHFQDHVNIVSSVVFDEMPVVRFRPVDNVLLEMHTAVTKSLQTIEAEASRISLIR